MPSRIRYCVESHILSGFICKWCVSCCWVQIIVPQCFARLWDMAVWGHKCWPQKFRLTCVAVMHGKILASLQTVGIQKDQSFTLKFSMLFLFIAEVGWWSSFVKCFEIYGLKMLYKSSTLLFIVSSLHNIKNRWQNRAGSNCWIWNHSPSQTEI